MEHQVPESMALLPYVHREFVAGSRHTFYREEISAFHWQGRVTQDGTERYGEGYHTLSAQRTRGVNG